MIDLFAKLEEVKRANQQMRNEVADSYNLLFNGIGQHISKTYEQNQQISNIQADTQSTMNAIETGTQPTFKTVQGASNYGSYQIADRKKQVDEINNGVAWMKENNLPLPSDWANRNAEDKIAHINKQHGIVARNQKIADLNDKDARELALFNKKEAIRTANDIKLIIARADEKGASGGLTPTQERTAKFNIITLQKDIHANQEILSDISNQGYQVNTDGSVTLQQGKDRYKLLNGVLYKNDKKQSATNVDNQNIAKKMQTTKNLFMKSLSAKNSSNMKLNTYYAVYPSFQPQQQPTSQPTATDWLSSQPEIKK